MLNAKFLVFNISNIKNKNIPTSNVSNAKKKFSIWDCMLLLRASASAVLKKCHFNIKKKKKILYLF